MIALLVVALSAPAALPNRSSLFIVPKETAETAAAKVEVELHKALDERSVSLTDLESLFPVDMPGNRAPALIKEGTDAVDNLDFDTASAKFTEALTFLDQNPAVADAKEASTLHLHLANIALQTGGKPGLKQAAEQVMKAVILNPQLELDPKYFGPDVKKLVDKALVDINKAPKAQLTIASLPLGAEVSFRGAVLGVTPLPESPVVPVGRHLVTIKKPGFKPAGAFVSVTKEGGQISLELSEAEGYAKARRAMASLVPSNLGKGLPKEAREVAETMKSRFLIVAEVGAGGVGPLEVWDVETKSRLKDLELPNDGAYGPIVDKVKAFLANPSPVAVAKKDDASVRDTAEPDSGDSVFSKWWFWAVVGGVVVAGTATGIGVAAAQGAPPPRPAFNPVLFPISATGTPAP
ncbi:MAG: PEGA domain-containing protein [Myxococcaceae bacterium]|nr:PEGA domain-containing protein [Myxococcaceae bacterium]